MPRTHPLRLTGADSCEAQAPLEGVFTPPTWRKAPVLLAGVLIASGGRTVASALCAIGFDDDPDSPDATLC